MKAIRAGLIMMVMGMFSATALAQLGGTTAPPMGNRLYFGGGLSFGAGTNSSGFRYSYYSVFPIIGYKINPQFSAGTGLNYQHYSYPDIPETYSQYGVSPFLRYNFNPVFFQAEYNAMSSPTYDYTTGLLNNRQMYSRVLLGIGFSQPFSQNGRGAINALLMYDVLYHQPSVFNSPIVARVFVTF